MSLFTALFIVIAVLFWIDWVLFTRRLRKVTKAPPDSLAAAEATMDWLENSREMKIRRRPFGNLYWDGWTWMRRP